jgi:uncharacterized protein
MVYQIAVTRNCNFNCRYCMRRVKYNDDMSDTCLDQTLLFIKTHFLSIRKDDDVLRFNITGGEPLLCFEKVKKLIDILTKFGKEQSLQNISFELGTNLSLLNEENMRYLIENNCNIFVGFDGIELAFNSSRIYKSEQKNPFETVYNNVHILYKNARKDLIALNMVINPRNVMYLYESVQFMYRTFKGVTLSLNIAYNENWDDEALFILKEHMILLAVLYANIITKENNTFSINLFDGQIKRNVDGVDHAFSNCGAGKQLYAFDTDGTIYVCGNFIACGIDKELVTAGNVYDGVNQVSIKKFQDSLFKINRKNCETCSFHKRCYTYCPWVHYLATGDMFEITKKHCEIEKILVITADTIIDNIYKMDKNIFEKRFLKERI